MFQYDHLRLLFGLERFIGFGCKQNPNSIGNTPLG